MNPRPGHFHIQCGIAATKREITAQPGQRRFDKRPGKQQSSIFGFLATATDNRPDSLGRGVTQPDVLQDIERRFADPRHIVLSKRQQASGDRSRPTLRGRGIGFGTAAALSLAKGTVFHFLGLFGSPASLSTAIRLDK